ncbi:hypothetical protein LR48_Vigan06g063400 [Vigna angularis]|uniref:Uncharacterized protein n=1 Tax=Phaseolus angularis TaxID=3914 RepID=A0A0L9URD9_PHAAN|nr:hypothetical protein LR48_Vigan06g063400 [Vigna angularis]
MRVAGLGQPRTLELGGTCWVALAILGPVLQNHLVLGLDLGPSWSAYTEVPKARGGSSVVGHEGLQARHHNICVAHYYVGLAYAFDDAWSPLDRIPSHGKFVFDSRW